MSAYTGGESTPSATIAQSSADARCPATRITVGDPDPVHSRNIRRPSPMSNVPLTSTASSVGPLREPLPDGAQAANSPHAISIEIAIPARHPFISRPRRSRYSAVRPCGLPL